MPSLVRSTESIRARIVLALLIVALALAGTGLAPDRAEARYGGKKCAALLAGFTHLDAMSEYYASIGDTAEAAWYDDLADIAYFDWRDNC